MKKRVKKCLSLIDKLVSLKYFTLIFYGLLFLLIFSYTFTFPIDPDLGWHLRYGQETISRGRVLTQDIFSHTFRGQSLVDTEWLIETVFYFIFSHWSFLGLAIYSALFTSSAFFLPIIAFPGELWLKFSLVIWSVIGSATIFFVGSRPQNFSLCFFSLVLVALLKYQSSGRAKYIAFLPLVFWLWANVHPGFFLGIFLVFVFLMLEIPDLVFAKKNLKIVIGFSIVLCLSIFLSNYRPHSFQNVPKISYIDFFKSLILPVSLTVKESAGGITRQTIYEWLPIGFIDLPGYVLFLFGSVFSVGMYLLKPIAKRDFKNVLLLLGMVFFSSLYVRNIPYFFLVFIPLVLINFRFFQKKLKTKILFSGLNLAIVILMIFLIAAKLPKNARIMMGGNHTLAYYCQSSNYPCGAIEFIKKERPKGKMFNPYNWGGFLIWQLPEYPVFIDGRVSGNEVFLEYRKIDNIEKDWQEILRKYDVQWAIIEAHSQLENALKTEEKWQEIYKDEIAVVLVKQ